MAETQSAEVNLEELLNKVRTQPLQEQLDNIRFRPLAAKAEKRKAKIDKQKKKAGSENQSLLQAVIGYSFLAKTFANVFSRVDG